MHLSPLSDGYKGDARRLQGRAHQEGLVRGLAVLAVFGLLMGLGFISSDDRPQDDRPRDASAAFARTQP